MAIGIPLGAAIAWYRPVREYRPRVLEIFRNTAALAILPVFTLILGIGEVTKYTIVCYASPVPDLAATRSAALATLTNSLCAPRACSAWSPVATFRKVALPAAMPTIFTGIRLAGARARCWCMHGRRAGRGQRPGPRLSSSTLRRAGLPWSQTMYAADADDNPARTGHQLRAAGPREASLGLEAESESAT